MGNAFDKILELKRQLHKTVQEEGAKILQEEFKRVLDLMPEVEAIVWVQNHSVYNDETYEFEHSDFAAIPVTDCPWRAAYSKELVRSYDLDEDQNPFTTPVCWRDAEYSLKHVATKDSDNAERIEFILQTLKDLTKSCPQEVLETFDDVAARATREGITFEPFDYGY